MKYEHAATTITLPRRIAMSQKTYAKAVTSAREQTSMMTRGDTLLGSG